MTLPPAAQPAALGPLREWAALPAPARVLAAARAKLETGRSGDRVRIPVTLTPADRSQVGRLLGLRWAVGGNDVTLGLLRRACASSDADLEALLVAVGGPLRDRGAEALAEQRERQHRHEVTTATLVAAGTPEAVVALLLSRRWLGKAADRDFLDQVNLLAALLKRLPGDGVLLANLAQELLDDPHALDRDRVLGRCAARVLAATAAHRSLETAADSDPLSVVVIAAAESVGTAAGWRDAWASGGVSCDQLSSTVLVLNVSVPGAGPAGALLRAATELAEPVWLTARMLRAGWPPAPGSLTGVLVRLCENPSVIEAAADRLDARCPPLVCTYGRPSLAARELLRGLVGAGAALEISADRDSAGQSILADLRTRLPSATDWLPEVPGLYEEQRLTRLLDDLCTRR